MEKTRVEIKNEVKVERNGLEGRGGFSAKISVSFDEASSETSASKVVGRDDEFDPRGEFEVPPQIPPLPPEDLFID